MLSITIVVEQKLPMCAISCWRNALCMLTFDHFHAEDDKHSPLPHAEKNLLPACVEKLLKTACRLSRYTPPESLSRILLKGLQLLKPQMHGLYQHGPFLESK